MGNLYLFYLLYACAHPLLNAGRSLTLVAENKRIFLSKFLAVSHPANIQNGQATQIIFLRLKIFICLKATKARVVNQRRKEKGTGLIVYVKKKHIKSAWNRFRN